MKYCILEAIRRKCDSTHQDVRFLEGILTHSAEKSKVKQEMVPYTYQDVTFFRRRFAAFDRKRKVMQEPLPYTGKT